MKFRVKYWLILCGANLMLTLISAIVHAMFMTCFSFIAAVVSWYMAGYLLNKENRDE